MQARIALAGAAAGALLVICVPTDVRAGDDHHHGPPVRISIEAPKPGAFMTPTGWSLVLRIETPGSVAIVESPEEPTQPIGRREAIVLTDPDGCIDMRHFPIIRAGTPYEDCAGPDETFLEFTTERNDTFDLADSNTGNFQVRDRLLDDPFAPGVLLNKPYLRNTAGNIVAVPRPQTDVPCPQSGCPTPKVKDGFGFGPDDDLVALVLMVDLGATRSFDENFDRTQTRAIRNMAGFINSISQELVGRRHREGSALNAYMHVAAGMFEPIALFDLDVTDPSIDYLRRLESGPVQAFNFITPPQNDDDVLQDISSTYGTYEVDLRAVLVETVPATDPAQSINAPTFIMDMNNDGRFTSSDLRRMGYKVISNEARLRFTLSFDVLVSETSTGRTCPPASLIYRDLDGNGRDGAINCSGTGGATRVRRPPL
jgi:hypothetical protein